MKAILILYNQAYNDEIVNLLEKRGQRGYTRWDEISGRGSFFGEPHLGNHAWPALNIGIMVVVEDEIVSVILDDLKNKNSESEKLGLRAFVWSIESMV